MSHPKSSVLLDVDPSIIESNLFLKSTNDELNSLFPSTSGKEIPWKLVTPSAGFCLKLRSEKGNPLYTEKIFINVCHTKDIPGPDDISDRRLLELWQADTTCDYRVPMSLGEHHTESDKSGNPATVFDVAINTDFFNKVQNNQLFHSFFLEVVFEGLEQKFSIELDRSDYVVLKNRRSVGAIRPHRIQQRDKKTGKPGTPLIQELGSRPLQVQASRSDDQEQREPEPPSRLLREPASGPLDKYIAQIQLPDVISASEFELLLGEDRVFLTSERRKYKLQMFLREHIDPKFSTAEFNTDNKILTVSMPVVAPAL